VEFRILSVPSELILARSYLQALQGRQLLRTGQSVCNRRMGALSANEDSCR
jgi:hypothetical protein